MQLFQRSYTTGQYFRPKPVVIERPESHLIVVATPWGPVEHAQKSAEIVVEQFEILSNEDLTTPFESIPTLNAAANRLRIGLLSANQYLFKNENAKAWKTAVEVMAIHSYGGVLSWANVGSPHLLVANKTLTLPLQYQMDWEIQSLKKGPLFSQALGLEGQALISAGSVRVPPKSRLVMLAHSHWPRQILNQSLGQESAEQDLESLLQIIVQESSDSPFWMAVTDLSAA